MLIEVTNVFLNKTEVAQRIGVGRTNVDYIIKTDPTFPKPVQLTPSRPHWLDVAIDAWALARSEMVNQKQERGRAA